MRAPSLLVLTGLALLAGCGERARDPVVAVDASEPAPDASGGDARWDSSPPPLVKQCIPNQTSGGGGIGTPCTSDANCVQPFAPYCGLKTGTCGSCKTDAECTKPKHPRCVPLIVITAGCPIGCPATICNQCTSDADCAGVPEGTGKCNGIGSCTRCDKDQECTAAGLGVACSKPSGRCLRCLSDKDCTKGIDGTGRCWPGDNTCSACVTQTECDSSYGAGQYICK